MVSARVLRPLPHVTGLDPDLAERYLEPDYRLVGWTLGVLGGLACTGYVFVMATTVGNAPFERAGVSQGGVLVLYWLGWLALGRAIGWAAPRISGRMGAATVGAVFSVAAFASVMLLNPWPEWRSYIIPFGIIGCVIGALSRKRAS